MNTPDIVFVVGAGASCEFGLPNGPHVLFTLGRNDAAGIDFLTRVPQYHPLRSDGQLEHWRRRIEVMTQRIKHTEHPTVDEFINDVSSEIDQFVVQWLVHDCIAKQELTAIKSFSLNSDHWLNRFRSVRSSIVNRGLSWGVVTFNYDHLIEWSLNREALSRGLGMGSLLAREQVLHVHGETLINSELWNAQTQAELEQKLSLEASTPYQTSGLVLSSATSLKRVGTTDEETSSRAHAWITKAAAVCFLGFGFHRSCLETLKLDASKPWPNKSALFFTSDFSFRGDYNNFLPYIKDASWAKFIINESSRAYTEERTQFGGSSSGTSCVNALGLLSNHLDLIATLKSAADTDR